MRKSLILLAIVCCIAGLCGCLHSPAETTAPTAAYKSMPDAAQVYSHAADLANACDAVTVEVFLSQRIEAGSQSFTTTSKQVLTYCGRGGSDFSARVEETATYGSYTADITEIYTGGTVYSTVSGSAFSARLDAQSYMSRYLPVVLLDPALYANIEWADSSTVAFTQPTAAEAWLPADAELISASGAAQLDADGHLAGSSCTVRYLYGETAITTEIRQTLLYGEADPVSPPKSNYTPVEDIDAPRLLERAYGLLLQADAVSSSVTRNVTCQAVSTATQLHTTIHAAQDMFLIDQSTTLNGSDTSFETLTELYRNGIYTVRSGDGEPKTDAAVTADSMRQHTGKLLTANIPALTYLAGAESARSNGTVIIQFPCNQAMDADLRKQLNHELFDNEVFLDSLATQYVGVTAQGYLTVHAHTGLPISAGLLYEGCYTIEGIDHAIILDAAQDFELIYPAAYEEILSY